MSKTYKIGEYCVDLSRNQIDRNGSTQNLPPKVLEVLTVLAENPRKVVSYNELLEKVWPSTMVTPNTLQSCIAQLRKAFKFEEESKNIIKTHSKKGYSLEADVDWGNTPQPNLLDDRTTGQNSPSYTQQEFDSEAAFPFKIRASLANEDGTGPKKSTLYSYRKAALIGLLLILVLVAWYPDSSLSLQLNKIRNLTATDVKEYNATYSADGDYIIFHRFYETTCSNNLWAKNVKTLEESRLSQVEGYYGRHSLSNDGSKLLFVKQEDCAETITHDTCFSLMTLDLNEAILQPQPPKEILKCQNSEIKNPVWIDAENLAMLQKQEQTWQLIRYSIQDHISESLYEVEGGRISSFSFSKSNQSFTVISIKSDGQQYIETVLLDGAKISSHPIKFPSNMSSFIKINPVAIPKSKHFLFGFSEHFYSLSKNGEVTQLPFILGGDLSSPSFHPQEQKLLMVKGHYDGDVAKLEIQRRLKSTMTSLKSDNSFSVVGRSNEFEDAAKFNPKSNGIAFVSEQTGVAQVWLSQDSTATLISDFPQGNYIRNLFWDRSGDGLMVLANNELYRLMLDTPDTTLDLPFQILELFHWDSDTQEVIANVLVDGKPKLMQFYLHEDRYELITHKSVKWAAKTPNNNLIFMDVKDQFWKRGAIEDELITTLTEMGSSKRFVATDEFIYGINKKEQVWSYHVPTQELNIIANHADQINHITDIKDQQLLASIAVADKREIIELNFSYK